ncbi:MAG: cysteine desulfurase [Gemmatimonadaceae bacterium]|jgi:cysteine desulfurase/selenocysteine lyase|nr:cysteine desulfurase [Gemmatimonadaceae bacterium]
MTPSSPLVPRDAFPLLAQAPALRYLDSAATAQKPRVVLDALRDFYEHDNANPHRGAYALSARATERYHAARETIARFIGARDADCVLFVRGTTEAMNLVAGGWARTALGPGDAVLVTAMDHHASFVTWQQTALRAGAEFRIAELTADGRIDLDDLRAKLADGRVKLVSFPHVSNALGTINPVAEIVALAKAQGAIVVCDGAQGVPHLAVDVEALGVDVYAFSGHKLGGPMGIGVLWGRRALLERMAPWQFGGDMIEFVHDDHTTFNVLPHRFEAGTPNAAGAVGLAAACDFVSALGLDAVRSHERTLTAHLLERLGTIDGLRITGPADAASRSGVVSFLLDDVHAHDLATILDQHGVCVRAGHHCAQPLMRRLGVPATVRASFWVHSDADDVEALVGALGHAKALFADVTA